MKKKVDIVVETISKNKVVPVEALAEAVYGESTKENIRKLYKLISVCKIKGRKTKNIYCAAGYYFDISSILKEGSGNCTPGTSNQGG